MHASLRWRKTLKGGSRRAETSTRLLYLYVDVVLALGDDLDVGIVDGLLVVLDARRPVRRRPQHLANTDMRGVEKVPLQRAEPSYAKRER